MTRFPWMTDEDFNRYTAMRLLVECLMLAMAEIDRDAWLKIHRVMRSLVRD